MPSNRKNSTPGSVLSNQAKKKSRGSSIDDTAAGQQRGEDTPGGREAFGRACSYHTAVCAKLRSILKEGGRV